MSALAEFKDIMDSGEAISNRVYENSVKDYPYFILPHLLKLQRATQGELDAQESKQLVARLAMMLPERAILYSISNTDSAALDTFYPEPQEHEEVNTVSTIDSFLKSFGKTSSREEELIAQQIFNPTPEYATLLAAEFDEKSALQGVDLSENDQRINDFIQNRNTPTESAPEPADSSINNAPVDEPEEYDDSMLSESLAKIYIKQGKYAKALEIITKISLTNSEKSIYFADQIRFLKKLIINERFKA
ncbi:MAG: hypothetical protein R3Y22_09040 [Bacteroidales bacterium]